MEYEVIQNHKYQDIYRVCYGVLLIVNKYKDANYDWYFGYTKKNKKKLKKISGLKNCFETTEDIEVHNYKNKGDDTLPKGSIIFKDYVIEPTNNKEEYFYELKTTGSCFSGKLDEFNKLLSLVNEIMERY